MQKSEIDMKQPPTIQEIESHFSKLPPYLSNVVTQVGTGRVQALLSKMPPSAPPSAGLQPADWPGGIQVEQADFQNWSEAIERPAVWVAKPQQAMDVVTIANWAAGHGFRVRASGRSHNWSPLVIGSGDNVAGTLLVDTSGLKGMKFQAGPPAQVTAEVGASFDELLSFLHDPNVVGSAGDVCPGYAFRNMTGPGGLSVGGVLAIGGHGTSVSSSGTATGLNGCLSNLIVSFTAVVTDPSDPGTYGLKTFSRRDPEAAAFLVHLGRAFLVEATLQVIPDYWLRLDNQFPDTVNLFAPQSANPPADTFASFVDQSGRVEVIWFPYTTSAWTKTWTLETTAPANPSGPYYIPLVNDIPLWLSNVIAAGLQAVPSGTPAFCKGDAMVARAAASGTVHGAASNLLRYVKDDTLRVTAGGFAVHTARADVQYVVSSFVGAYQHLLDAATASGQYPMNSAVEIRVTGTDTVAGLAVPDAQPPALSATAPIRETLDTVVWVDALSIANSSHYQNPATDPFYVSLESALLALWGPQGTDTSRAIIRPEWSKGWGFTAAGAWTKGTTIDGYLATFPRYKWATETLAKYDAAGIFTDDFLSKFIVNP